MSYIKGTDGKPLTHWVAVLYGDFDGNLIVFRYPQIKGVQWHRHVMPALIRYAKENLNYKKNGIINVCGLLDFYTGKDIGEQTLKQFDKTKQTRIDYDIATKRFIPLPLLGTK